MKQTIANPIYDSVFKYLVEDERIARTLLSALLKKDVVQVETRPHEYSNETKDNKIAMFRVDFAATVREAGGTERLVLVELQKTWVETETLRFRRYLGAQYNNKRNMADGGKGSHALPMVAVYLLGHRVGDIEEPVLYVSHKAYDYDDREVTKGMPDPFVESLQHDSIIVQIPLLRGQVNNRLDKVLSVFDQTKAGTFDKQVIELDADAYAGDDDMQYIVRRLTAAAADARMRENMNVEDEYYSVIENRDTAIMDRDRQLAEKNLKIAELDDKIAKQKHTLAEKENALAEKENALVEKDNALVEKENALAEKDNALAEKDDIITKQNQAIANIAKAMSAQGIPVESISKMTGKTVAEIQSYL